MTTNIYALGAFNASPGHLLVTAYMGLRETAIPYKKDLEGQAQQSNCDKYKT